MKTSALTIMNYNRYLFGEADIVPHLYNTRLLIFRHLSDTNRSILEVI